MLLLTSFLDLVRDTFEKRNSNNLGLEAVPIIHCLYYVMGKTANKRRVSSEGKKRTLL